MIRDTGADRADGNRADRRTRAKQACARLAITALGGVLSMGVAADGAFARSDALAGNQLAGSETAPDAAAGLVLLFDGPHAPDQSPRPAARARMGVAPVIAAEGAVSPEFVPLRLSPFAVADPLSAADPQALTTSSEGPEPNPAMTALAAPTAPPRRGADAETRQRDAEPLPEIDQPLLGVAALDPLAEAPAAALDSAARRAAPVQAFVASRGLSQAQPVLPAVLGTAPDPAAPRAAPAGVAALPMAQARDRLGALAASAPDRPRIDERESPPAPDLAEISVKAPPRTAAVAAPAATPSSVGRDLLAPAPPRGEEAGAGRMGATVPRMARFSDRASAPTAVAAEPTIRDTGPLEAGDAPSGLSTHAGAAPMIAATLDAVATPALGAPATERDAAEIRVGPAAPTPEALGRSALWDRSVTPFSRQTWRAARATEGRPAPELAAPAEVDQDAATAPVKPAAPAASGLGAGAEPGPLSALRAKFTVDAPPSPSKPDND